MSDEQNQMNNHETRRGRPRIDRAERSDSREETGRSTRVPLGVARPKLAVPSRPGYVRRWINDDQGRIQQAIAGGYQFADEPSIQIGSPDIDNTNRDLGTRVSRVVDKSTGKNGYLMEIKQEYYEEDQRIKMQDVDEVESAIKKGALRNDIENKYVPDNGRGIKITRD